MPYRVDDRLAGRHPFELFTLYLAFLVALPTVLQIIPEPGSIRALMPAWLSWGWSATLLAGSVTAIAGIYWRNRITGLILEQLGLAGTGVGAAAYAVAVVYIAGTDGLIAGAFCIGFSVACVRRYFHIQQTLDVTHEVQVRREKGELS